MEQIHRVRKKLANNLLEKGCRKGTQDFLSVSWTPPANRNIPNEEDSLLRIVLGMYYTAGDCRSCHQLEESSTASFTFMEQHPHPMGADADSAPLLFCSTKGVVFPRNLVFWVLLFAVGIGRRGCPPRVDLEIIGKITPYTATLCQLLHLRSTQHVWLG